MGLSGAVTHCGVVRGGNSLWGCQGVTHCGVVRGGNSLWGCQGR